MLMRDWAHSRRLGTPADEAGYVVLRQPPASKIVAIKSLSLRLRQYDSSEIRVGLAQAVQERSGRGAGVVIERLDLEPHPPQGQG